jgi:phosphoglycerol transferase MdoB-like AlkP superfamily enzyme
VLQASSTVQQAQNAVVLVKRSTAFIFVATVLAWILALLLAHRRRRTALTLVISGIVVMLLARFAINRVVSESPNLVVNPGARAALASALRTLAGGLFTTITWLVIIGLIAAIVVTITGNGARMTALRARIGEWAKSLTSKKSQ